MPGHSGGPCLDEAGAVVAWNVRNRLRHDQAALTLTLTLTLTDPNPNPDPDPNPSHAKESRPWTVTEERRLWAVMWLADSSGLHVGRKVTRS